MTFLKKILPLLIVAIVFVVGGYFVGSGMNTEQGASIYRGTSIATPPGLVHLFYSNGACNIYKWDSSNNTWSQIGSLGGVNERNCHDLPPANPNTGPQLLSSTGSTTLPGVAKGDVITHAGVINMGWIDGIGCNIFRWNDNTKSWDSLGVATGVSKANCMAIAVHPTNPINPTKSNTTPPVKNQ